MEEKKDNLKEQQTIASLLRVLHNSKKIEVSMACGRDIAVNFFATHAFIANGRDGETNSLYFSKRSGTCYSDIAGSDALGVSLDHGYSIRKEQNGWTSLSTPDGKILLRCINNDRLGG